MKPSSVIYVKVDYGLFLAIYLMEQFSPKILTHPVVVVTPASSASRPRACTHHFSVLDSPGSNENLFFLFEESVNFSVLKLWKRRLRKVKVIYPDFLKPPR